MGLGNRVAVLTTVFPANNQYVHEFLGSLKLQTYTDFDVVIVNDGLSGFGEIRRNYEGDLNIIGLDYSDAPAKNREHGINYCIENNYDILIFGDSDDYFSENRVEKSVEYLVSYDIVVNDLTLFDDKGVIEDKYISNRLNDNDVVQLDFIKDKNIFGLSNTAIRLKGVQKVKIEKDVVAVDWFLFGNLLKEGRVAVFSNKMITYYRQYYNNTVGLSKKDGKYVLWWEGDNKEIGIFDEN